MPGGRRSPLAARRREARLPGSVTVVVTNYNHAGLLAEAVESALAQSVLPGGVVVVDDCSTDASSEALDRLPPEVRVVRMERNGGVVAARNRGLEEVRTPFVVFLDSDDLLMPRFVERTLAAWRRAGDGRLAVVYSPARRLYDPPVGPLGRRRGYLLSRRFDPGALGRENFICNTSLLLVEAVRAVGGYAAAMERLGHEDWDLFLSLVEQGWGGRLVPRPLFCYRTGGSGRNAASLRRWPEVSEAIASRHPLAAAAARRPAPSERRRSRLAATGSQPLWCLVDLLEWFAGEPRPACAQDLPPAGERR